MDEIRNGRASAAELHRKVTMLARELDEAREQQAATADVLKVISGSTFDLDAVLTTVIRSGIKFCDATRGVIWLKKGEQLFLAAHVGYSDEWVGFAQNNPITPAADAVTTSGLAAFTGEVVHVEDVPNDPRFRSLAAHKLGDYRAGVAVPLKRDGEIVGVISLSRPEARLFTERQVALVETFAAQAVIAIENARLFTELESRNREITEALDQQTATSNILGVIASSPGDVTPVLEAIAESAARLCQAFDAIVRLKEGDVLIFGAHYGPIPVDPKARVISRKWTGGRSVVDRATIHVHDLADAAEEFPEGWAMAHRFGHRTTLAVPLLREGEAIGTMMLRRMEVKPFSEAQISVLRTFADQAVIAIENAHLFEEVRARNRELSEALEQQVATSAILRAIASSPTNIQPVLDAVTESAAQLCDGYDTTIFLRRGDALAVAAHRGPMRVDFDELPIRRDIVTSRAVLDRMPIHVHDLAAAGDEYQTGQRLARQMGFHTILATPLLWEGEAIGALMIRRAEMRPFSDRQVELLKTFADQAVIAIENVRLFEEVQARNRELSETLEQQVATSAILKVIAASPTDIQPVLNSVTDNAAQLCDAHDTVLFLRHANMLNVATHRGAIPLDFAEWPITRDFVAGRAVLDRAPVHVHDVTAAEGEFAESRMLALRFGFRTILATPLLREGEAIGALVIRRVEMRPFSDRQIELLQTFADQAVIAIENVRLFEEVQARNQALTESLEQQTATSEILSVISKSPTNVQPVFDTIAESAARLCEARFCAVFRFDGEVIHFSAQHGMPAEAAEIQRRAYPMAPGLASASSRAILSGKVEQIPNVDLDPHYALKGLTTALATRSVLSVPMLRNGQPVGAINIARSEPGHFPDRQIELLKTFADQAVIAIENVRLFDEVQVRTAELTESLQQQTATADVLKVISRSAFDLPSVLQTLVDSAVRLCGADLGAITMREGESLRFMAGSGQSPELRAYEISHPHPLNRGTFQGRAAVDQATVHVPDVRQDAEYQRQEAAALGDFRASLAVPLRRGGEVIGVFGLARRTVGPFFPRQIELVENFADQAVIAIENARLLEEVQARTQELSESLQLQTATADVLKVISRSTFDLPAVLDTLAESAARLCEADIVDFYRSVDDGFEWAASFGPEAEADRDHTMIMRQPGRGSVSGRVLMEHKTVHVPDFEADTEFTFVDVARKRGVHAILGVPLLREDTLIGLLLVMRKVPGPFSTKQIELAETFADQAVIAIENVRLFDEVQARTADLGEALQQQTATADVLKVISRSAFDLQSVLQTLIDSACTLCEAEKGGIYMLDGDVYRLAANHGMTAELLAHEALHPNRVGRDSFVGRTALEKAVVHVPDVTRDTEYGLPELPKIGGFAAVLSVPLMREGSAIGVFSMGRVEPGPFPPRQIELVQTFADQAVIAIENVRLFEEVQARTRDLEESLTFQKATSDVLEVIGRSASTLEPVLGAIVDTASTLCRADMAVIRLLRDGALQHAASSSGMDTRVASYARENNSFPIDRSSIAGRVTLEGRTIHVEDAAADREYTFFKNLPGAPVRTMLGVPLIREGTVVGAIILWRTSVDLFTERQIALVQTFADQAVIAIQNVRLFEAVQARTAELSESLQQQTATADVLKLISRSTFDLQTVLDTLTESAAKLCEADMAAMTRQNEEGEGFHYATNYRFPSDWLDFVRTVRLGPGRGSIVGRALLGHEVVHVEDVLADPEYTYSEQALKAGYRTFLAVPMMREGNPIGVLVLTRKTVRPFTSKQIEIVETFADQAVIAIENVRLFEEVQHRTDELSRSLDELRTAQNRLIQTEKLASLGQLTAGIAHEIKNPLNFVNNFSALSAELIGELGELLDGAGLEAKTRADVKELSAMLRGNLDKVVQHGKRADSIVKNMLLHSREGSGEHRPIDINMVVEESLNLAYHGARAEKRGFNVTMEKSLDPTAGDVDLFPQEMTRVLLNLISNGFYATTKRNVELNGVAYEPTLSASTKNLGDSVEIRIRDNGTGIPPAVKERMFNPFFTTKPAGEGTGLGLSLSHDIVVKQHAGTIEVETEPGAFTEFRIVLPRNAASLGSSGGKA